MTNETYRQLYAYDAEKRNRYPILCGIDEAGRGPLCGPVSCAAVILDPNDPIEGINDSKKLSEKKREILYSEITKRALAYNVVLIDAEIIDEINILNATMQGMTLAAQGLSIKPEHILIDGNRVPAPLSGIGEAVIGGDAKSACIAAASILAKVTRDHIMLELDRQYPQYQLAKHKGYGTKLHYEMIEKYGIQPFYRKSFLKKLGY